MDLSPLAGNENVRIRFDFSTSGGMHAHYDSAELVAVPGDEIVHQQRISFTDEDANQVLLENIVGTEVIFPSGGQIVPGDFITLRQSGGATHFLQFVSGAAGPNEVQITTGMSANEVARAVIAALDTSVQAAGPETNNATDGRVRFAAVDQFNVIGDSLIAESNPIFVQRVDSGYDGAIFINDVGQAPQIVVPDGRFILPGDTLELTTSGFATTVFTFVETATFAPNEIVFTATESADTIARRLMANLPADVQAVYEGDGVITLLDQGISASSVAATTSDLAPNSTVTDTDHERIEIEFPPALTVNNNLVFTNDVVTINHRGGQTQVQLVAAPSFFPTPGVIEIEITQPTSSFQIARLVQQMLPVDAGAIINANGNLSVLASSVTTANDFDELGVG